MSTATLIAKILAVAVVAAAATQATNPAGSAGGVSVTGPVCVTQSAQPGKSYTVPANVVNATGSTAQLDLATDPGIGPPAGPPYPVGGHPIPRSWVTLSGPYTIGGQSTVPAPVTVNVPPGTLPGRYGTTLEAHSFGVPGSGGDQVAFGGGAGTWLEISVRESPPPRAFCTGQRQTYWPWSPPLPVCQYGEPPMLGRQPWCRVLPLSPPVFSATACGWTHQQMLAYLGQLKAAGRRYAHNSGAYLADAHCVVHGHILNRQAFYRGTGWYRFADTRQTSPASTARTW
jgi:hypothetical protein